MIKLKIFHLDFNKYAGIIDINKHKPGGNNETA